MHNINASLLRPTTFIGNTRKLPIAISHLKLLLDLTTHYIKTRNLLHYNPQEI